MTDDKNIPEYALQPAKELDEMEIDEFDPSPYDRLLSWSKQKKAPQSFAKPDKQEFQQEMKPVMGKYEETDGLGEQLEEALAIPSEEELFEEEAFHLQVGAEDFPLEETFEENLDANAKAEEEFFQNEIMKMEETYEEPIEEETKLASAVPVEPLTETVNAKPVTVLPMVGTLVTNELKMTDIREKPEAKVFIEEDILVPDTKEDLASILSMTGKLKLFDSEIHVGQMSQDSVKVAGEILLHTMYIPEKYGSEENIIAIQSKLPFKTDWTLNVAPLSHLVIKPVLESVDYTVINERKFRAKLTIRLTMREYANVELQVFQGIKGETLQLLKEKVQLTHVSERKNDVMEINESLPLKDSQPKPERILKYDVDIVENHKQITDEKAVVNATIYCNVLYLGKVTDPEDETETHLSPQLFQGKAEFTQFIPISNAAEGSRVAFSDKGLVVRIKEEDPEDDSAPVNAFSLEGEVETSIEIYKNLEREIVTDIYHRTKDVISDKVELETMSLGGSGVTEAAVREIINVPEKYGEVKRVIYISGNIKNSKSNLEQNKNVVEGVVEVNLLCIPEDEKKPAFSLTKDLNFRGAMEIPEAKGNTKANSEISIKELWFDRINSKQIEVNANLFIASSIYGQEKYQIIEKVCFVEAQDAGEVKPGMIVYITKSGDTLWDIAKKYRTTVDMITGINDLEKDQKLTDSTKLLIVR